MKNFLIGLSLFIICFQDAISQNNNALHFDTDSYVELNNISQGVSNLNEFTIEFWVKFDAQLNTDYNTLYGVNTGDFGNKFLIRTAGPVDGVEDAAVVFIDNGSNNYIIGNTPIGDNQCHHIAFTYDNGTCTLYVDGQLDGTGNFIFEFLGTDLHSLGQEYDMNPNVPSAFFNGELDDFRFWNNAKTQAEVDNNKDTELFGNEMNIVTYFNFNQGIAGGNNTTITNLNNLAQPSQNGVLVGFDLNESSISNFVNGACVNEVVSLNEHSVANQIKVFPNPTNGLLNLSNDENISSITIRNNLGQVVLQPQSNSLIDISDLSAAIYYMEILTYDNSRKVVRILKI